MSKKSQPCHTQPRYLFGHKFDHNRVVRLRWGCIFNTLVLKLSSNLTELSYLIKNRFPHAYVECNNVHVKVMCVCLCVCVCSA